jgi:hypothetical protein
MNISNRKASNPTLKHTFTSALALKMHCTVTAGRQNKAIYRKSFIMSNALQIVFNFRISSIINRLFTWQMNVENK